MAGQRKDTMNKFVKLFEAIDSTNRTIEKVKAIYEYLIHTDEKEHTIGIAILLGNKPKRPVKTGLLKQWASEISSVPLWLLEESYYIVGDLAETLTLILPQIENERLYSLIRVYKDLMNLREIDINNKHSLICSYWSFLNGSSLFVFNKFLTGNFRMGVSKKLVVKALSAYLDIDEPTIEHRLMVKWNPLETTVSKLLRDNPNAENHFIPYPFYLAYPLDFERQALGNIDEWIIEPKLDGIRGQLIVRKGELFIWSRGEELMNDKFVEFHGLENVLPDGTVIDGEIIPWKDNKPMDFNVMQTRIGRKKLTKRYLEEAPLVMMCYDLLEWEGKDVRAEPLFYRRRLLENTMSTFDVCEYLKLSDSLAFENWKAADTYRIDARSYHSEGLMVKRKDSVYRVGRKRGDWWKWKTDPMTMDSVLIYAQSGSGRRANLYTDYTFGVWDQGVLVPFTKAYSGLTDKELLAVDKWIKKNTIEKFGPVRRVKPELVFELAFEGINRSKRHKSGVAVRFPRILRWRKDKVASEANTKQDLLDLIHAVYESIR